MPREDLIPGFFGKMPAAGDFVSRGLPPAFIRSWDPWISRHLAPLLAMEPWQAHPALRFMLEADAGGPLAGVVMASRDRSGRRFPLTLAAMLPAVDAQMADAAAGWFDALEEAGDAARQGEADPQGLEDYLATLPFPASGEPGEALPAMVFWTDPAELFGVDPDRPHEALAGLLAGMREAG